MICDEKAPALLQEKIEVTNKEALPLKGGVISESIFNLVPLSNKCMKLLAINFPIFKRLKFADFGPLQKKSENFKHSNSES